MFESNIYNIKNGIYGNIRSSRGNKSNDVWIIILGIIMILYMIYRLYFIYVYIFDYFRGYFNKR